MPEPNRNTPAQWILDRIAAIRAGRGAAQGLDGAAGTATAPTVVGGSDPEDVARNQPPGGTNVVLPETPEETERKANDRINDPKEYPFPLDTKDNLERLYNNLRRAELIRDGWVAQAQNPPKLKSGAVDTEAEKALNDKAKAAEAAHATALTAATAEQNRVDTKAETARKEAEAKAEKANTQPKNGDTQTVRVEHKGISGTVTKTYNNGVWSDVSGSFKPDASVPNNTAAPTRTLYTAQDGTAYWVDPSDPSKVTRLDGVGGKYALGQINGETWLMNPDGTPGKRLAEASPELTVVNNTKVYTDKNSGKVIARVDLLDPAQRARADRLDALAERTAELGVQQGENALQPKFASAQAQYVQEAQRRQKLARTELDRLLKLQEEGQISPDQAQAQFDRWMQVNVEGPLAGYERAAQQERQEQAQADLTRTNTEATRVDEFNQRRGQLAYEAGEAGRTQAIDIGKRTRAPEYIADLGRVANSMATGQPFSGFSPGTFDVANYRKVVPNVQELADAAVERLLSRIGGPATAREVNVPRQPLPTGESLRGLMDNVRYSGPMLAPPPDEQPLEGQGAVDQNNGMARSIYSNGRYVDWPITPTVPAP